MNFERRRVSTQEGNGATSRRRNGNFVASLRPCIFALLSLLSGALALGSQSVGESPQPPEPVVERLEDGRVRVEGILIDPSKRELRVPGFRNTATVLEYLANARQGHKSYESALELDATATGFNVAMILLGLDASRSTPSRHKFDPEPPRGDPVEIWIEWKDAKTGETIRVRAEELVYNAQTERTLEEGRWVYTGSVFLPGGEYMAEVDGVLIGFMHCPESIIDSPRALDARYGLYQINPELSRRGLEPGTEVWVTVRALFGQTGP